MDERLIESKEVLGKMEVNICPVLMWGRLFKCMIVKAGTTFLKGFIWLHKDLKFLHNRIN